MDELEFDRLLQRYMFGTVAPRERELLIDAALSSSDRSLEFARAEELREHFSDQAFRKALIDVLPACEPQESESSWKRWFRYDLAIPLIGGAATVVTLLVLIDRPWRDEVPSQAAVAPPSQPGAPDAAIGGDPLRPAATESTEAEMAVLFGLPESRSGDVALALPAGTRYRATDEVSVSVTLPAEGVLYAIVRDPADQLRQVYPIRPGDDAVLSPGVHEFVFNAVGTPAQPGGRFLLRVFLVTDLSSPMPPEGPDRWTWLQTNATYQEAAYEVDAP